MHSATLPWIAWSIVDSLHDGREPPPHVGRRLCPRLADGELIGGGEGSGAAAGLAREGRDLLPGAREALGDVEVGAPPVVRGGDTQ